MKNHIFVLFVLVTGLHYGQGNCWVYPENSGERKACELSYKAIEHAQGSKESQELFDEAIAIGPNYTYAYYEKSVPYFKRGFILEGLKYLNQAIQLEPLNYLPYRAYWYWQYKNYNLCITDLERFYNEPNSYNEFTPGGEKNMKLILGLAYAKTKRYEKAIQIIEDYIKFAIDDDYLGISDYHTLGVIYFKNKAYNKAISAFNNQKKINSNLAETYYYLGLIHKRQNDLQEAKLHFNKALLKMNDEARYYNINSGFPIYELQIIKEIENLKSIKP